jgi:NADH:ubiquinone oxidoreductase subunit 6 (subunit J)
LSDRAAGGQWRSIYHLPLEADLLLRRILGGVFLSFGVIGAALLFVDGGLVLLAGMIVLVYGGAIPLLALPVVPIVWAVRRPWRWLVAACVPLLSLAAIVIIYATDARGLLPAYAFSNLGPPLVAGQWLVFALVYIGVLGLRLPPRAPRPAQAAASPSPA